MPASPADLFRFLDRLGIVATTVEHPALFTVAQSQALRGEIAGAHTKNLFLKDRKAKLFLVVAREDASIDLKRLHERIGAAGRVSFGSAEAMLATLGVEPGAVTPFAALNDRTGAVVVVLDAAMLAHERLNFHPLVNTMTSAIGRDDLIAFLRATGHEPLIRAVSEGQAAENCQNAATTPC